MLSSEGPMMISRFNFFLVTASAVSRAPLSLSPSPFLNLARSASTNIAMETQVRSNQWPRLKS